MYFHLQDIFWWFHQWLCMHVVQLNSSTKQKSPQAHLLKLEALVGLKKVLHHDLKKNQTWSNQLEKHAPFSSVTPKPLKDFWITCAICYAKRRKRPLELTWLCNKSPYNRSNLQQFINCYNKLINNSKCNIYTNRIQQHIHNPSKLWKALDDTLHMTPSLALPDHTDSVALADQML